MIVEKKDKEAFYTAFNRRKKLVELLENTKKAMLGNEPEMKKELEKVERAVIEEIQKMDKELKSYESLLSARQRKNVVKRYEEVEKSGVPLTELNK